jgi:sulfopyruvate decarboxylase subunit beta
MMKRDQCFRILARHVTDQVVVATYSSAVDWLEIGERTLNYFSVGAMGLDSSHALGLALGRPDRRIICLQGDGSLLMNLGSLVTIAAAAPRNLVHIVVQNGTYEANGGHPIPNTKVGFATMARSAGYAQAHDFSDLANFEQQAGHMLAQDGPVFATLHVERAKPLSYDYPRLYDPARRSALKAALASPPPLAAADGERARRGSNQ